MSVRPVTAMPLTAPGTDVLVTIQNFVTALNANDPVGVRTAVGVMDDSIAQVSKERSRVGAMMNVFDVAANMARQTQNSSADARSQLEDVDIFEASTRLASTQRALEASISAAAQQFKLSLLDKL